MNLKAILTIMIFTGSLLVVSVLDADAARRFGGGRSFGSKPSMNRSTTAPKQQQPAVTQQQQGTQQGAAAAGAGARKPGMLGGMGGIFGGLLAGTLLGSLLFGAPFTGGGMMDILMIAILLYVAFRLFARFKMNQRATQPAAEGPAQYQQTDYGDRWDNLKQGEGGPATAAGPPVPEGFDVEDFLKGAKMAYNRLQAAWDKRDLEDIALFTSQAVQDEVKKQFEEDPEPGKTEILLSNAQLLSVTEENDEQRATVFFDVLLREDSNKDTAQAREVWHFVRPTAGGNWKLDGIQQVEM